MKAKNPELVELARSIILISSTSNEEVIGINSRTFYDQLIRAGYSEEDLKVIEMFRPYL
ncbi:MAG: hypothetical protein QGF74_03445 [Candidatus Nanoarchaeia archaeon]|nr:hypothetical protein [Candidatus Nanoarchaeia archaeon]